MFTPLTTERLLLRPARVSDTDALFERRADPVVSELQDWPMPYSRERAEAQIARAMADDAPSVRLEGGWYTCRSKGPLQHLVGFCMARGAPR